MKYKNAHWREEPDKFLFGKTFMNNWAFEQKLTKTLSSFITTISPNKSVHPTTPPTSILGATFERIGPADPDGTPSSDPSTFGLCGPSPGVRWKICQRLLCPRCWDVEDLVCWMLTLMWRKMWTHCGKGKCIMNEDGMMNTGDFTCHIHSREGNSSAACSWRRGFLSMAIGDTV